MMGCGNYRIVISLTVAALFTIVAANVDDAVEQSSSVDVRAVAAETIFHRRERRAAKNSLTQDERAQFLYEHNNYRKLVTPTAADMLKMVWNGGLESMAQEWANGCNYKHGQPARTTKPFDPIGQNLYVTSGIGTAAKAVLAWYNEINYYTYDTMACASGQQCGHYTQVAWAKSYAIGCGITLCPTIQGLSYLNSYYIVCNYGPAGNYVGQKPYLSGAKCSSCPTPYSTCDDGLCRAAEFCSAVTECTPTNSTYCLCDESFYLSASGGGSAAVSMFRITSSNLLLLPLLTTMMMMAMLKF